MSILNSLVSLNYEGSVHYSFSWCWYVPEICECLSNLMQELWRLDLDSDLEIHFLHTKVQVPVPHLACTLTMPLASMSKVTSTWGTPRGAGGIPTSWNWPEHHKNVNKSVSLYITAHALSTATTACVTDLEHLARIRIHEFGSVF